VIYAHHGYGEELIPLLASGGATLVSAATVMTRARLARLVRWLRRR
jgi:hypothetical protein